PQPRRYGAPPSRSRARTWNTSRPAMRSCARRSTARPATRAAEGSAPHHEHFDLEELRPRLLRRLLVAHHLSDRRHQLIVHEALECLARLPDVVDVPPALALSGAVDDQALRRVLVSHRRMAEHLPGDGV